MPCPDESFTTVVLSSAAGPPGRGPGLTQYRAPGPAGRSSVGLAQAGPGGTEQDLSYCPRLGITYFP
eukprot:758329-Hanusia_phi.AAC.3